MRRTRVLVLAALCVSCGPASQVRSFTVEPPLVCPGQTTQVQWDVVGRASLRAQRSANDWDEGQVPSTGTRTVAPASSTTFTVTALDANPANGAWQGSKSVQVVSLPESERAAVTTCDPASRKCTGKFTIDATGAVQVRSLSQPTLIRSGASHPASITASHWTWQQALAPGQTVQVGQPASGPWTLEVDLAQNEDLTPPPQLRVHVDFGCP